jgi:tungstate transport system ATP-binding protein
VNEFLYELQGVKQDYNGRNVLAIEQMQIKRGEILAIVGPSGAGKSTLLRLLNFLEPPTAGHIHFDGVLVDGSLPLLTRRRVTTVFQKPALLKRSVAANIAYGLSLRGKKLAPERLDEWLNRLGLQDLGKQKASRLSAGEAQRVALARALVIQPDVLLLDEPTANLDPYNVDLLEKIVGAENRQNGTTMVLVTHNVFQARRIAHRTALLLGGKLVELAATAVFFDNPQQPQTSAFVRGELVY